MKYKKVIEPRHWYLCFIIIAKSPAWYFAILEQKERDQVLVQFANKSSSILIATDVAARGLDIKDLQAVINYELPHDPEIHIHRIGRTGRAGKVCIKRARVGLHR